MASSRRLSKLPGREVDGADDGALVVGEEQLGVELDVFELVDFDAEILQDAEAADAFDELIDLELVRRAGHDVNLDAAGIGADEVLDDGGVLVALVLEEEGVLGVVDEFADALAAVADAPDEVGVVARSELGAIPVGVEALHDLVDLVLMGGEDGVVASLGEVAGLPVQRLDEGELIVDDHGLFMGDVEVGIAVVDLYTGSFKGDAAIAILFFAVAPLRVKHDADLYATLVGRDDRLQKVWVGEDEHLYAD